MKGDGWTLADYYAISLAVAVAQGNPTLINGTMDESVLRESLQDDETRVASFLYIFDVLDHTDSPNGETDLLRLLHKPKDSVLTVVNKSSVHLNPENYDYIGKMDLDGGQLFYNQYCDKKDGSDLIDTGEKVVLGKIEPVNPMLAN